MSTCFVCLEKCHNKVCSVCQCYAHSKCWGKYLQSSTPTSTAVAPNMVVVFTPWSAECPQCRGRISNVKPITRSDTNLARRLSITLDYYSFLTILDDIEYYDVEERFELYSKLLDVMMQHKAIIRANDWLSSILKDRLKVLYKEDNWIAANMYHHGLFGQQISRKRKRNNEVEVTQTS